MCRTFEQEFNDNDSLGGPVDAHTEKVLDWKTQAWACATQPRENMLKLAKYEHSHLAISV